MRESREGNRVSVTIKRFSVCRLVWVTQSRLIPQRSDLRLTIACTGLTLWTLAHALSISRCIPRVYPCRVPEDPYLSVDAVPVGRPVIAGVLWIRTIGRSVVPTAAIAAAAVGGVYGVKEGLHHGRHGLQRQQLQTEGGEAEKRVRRVRSAILLVRQAFVHSNMIRAPLQEHGWRREPSHTANRPCAYPNLPLTSHAFA